MNNMRTRGLTVKEAGHRGGTSRAKNLTREQRVAIAQKASDAAREKYYSLPPEERSARGRKANLASQEARRLRKAQSV